jgi:hypothetical protein
MRDLGLDIFCSNSAKKRNPENLFGIDYQDSEQTHKLMCIRPETLNNLNKHGRDR